MSFQDFRINASKDAIDSQPKTKEREHIAAQTEEYLKNNKIEVLDCFEPSKTSFNPCGIGENYV